VLDRHDAALTHVQHPRGCLHQRQRAAHIEVPQDIFELCSSGARGGGEPRPSSCVLEEERVLNAGICRPDEVDRSPRVA
jgi:hypothetical protein